MSWRRRLRARIEPRAVGDRAPSAPAAAPLGSSPARGTLSSLVGRVLGHEAVPPLVADCEEPWLEPADEATLRALREELADELARVSSERQAS